MLKGLYDLIWGGVSARWTAAGPWLRAGIVAAVILILFAAARIGGFGAAPQRLSRVVVPVHLPVLDAAAPSGQVLIRAEIAGAGGWHELIPGDPCPTSSRLRFAFEATEPGWIAAFGLSASGRYALMENGFGPVKAEPGAPVAANSLLDDETGVEVFGVLYDIRPFSAALLDRVVLPHDRAIATLTAGKGGSLLSAFGPLPAGMTAQTLYCDHSG